MAQMQASTVLSTLYVGQVQKQLNASEEKAKKKHPHHVLNDGKAKYMTGDKFSAACEADAAQQEKEVAEKEEHRFQRLHKSGVLAEWKKQNEVIRKHNEARWKEWEAAVKLWEAERADSKAEKRWLGWSKLKLNWEKLIPYPIFADEGEEGSVVLSSNAGSKDENEDR